MSRKLSFVVNRFLAWADKCLAKSTVDVYRHYFRRFMLHHGDLPISKLRPAHLSEWADTWHACQAMKRLFNWATLDAGLATLHPFERVKHPPKGARRRIFKRVEMLQLLRATPYDLRALLIAHRETMARPQELREATWEHIQAEDKSLTPRRALETGKACIVLHDFKARKRRRIATAPRVILLSPRACRLLLRLLRDCPGVTRPIFVTAAGSRWTPNAVRCRFRRLRAWLPFARDSRGEAFTPYTFRHTGATLASAAGVRDRLLADVLGHVETSTTARYQHLSLDHLRAAMEKLWFVKKRIWRRKRRQPRR